MITIKPVAGLLKKQLKRIDWRLSAILLATAVSLAVTGLVYWFGDEDMLNPSTFQGALFASWVASLLLFAVIGLTVAVVSLVRPEMEGFDSPARVLFQRQTGPHIDYIISQMHSVFEHYAEKSKVTVSIEEYTRERTNIGFADA